MNGDLKELYDRLGLIEVALGKVETKIDGFHETNVSMRDDLREHEIWDRWVQGLLLAMVLTLIGKAFVR